MTSSSITTAAKHNTDELITSNNNNIYNVGVPFDDGTFPLFLLYIEKVKIFFVYESLFYNLICLFLRL